ncbi:hypothetical protein LTR70_001315 [Exophiala xenobiotica]|uniref:Uncharacterized protein n=1 Tax=Lithohypha guttulata TaxID=1690604 RepID=A0ABR0KMS2_9EURO|nr:hypothetical protein LTR24_000929 [Lithohypha guttulata]KAK5327994.1 hypothetical protein LTR70_001315 [Exophiala xenobiotica]
MSSAQASASNNNYLGVSPAQRHVVNATQAQQVVDAAVQEAMSIPQPQNIAVTDPAGFLVAFHRMDSAFPASIDISMKKARTVALFNGAMTTAQWYNISQPGASLYGIQETNGGLVVFGGGVPLVVNGIFIGAVGVSGGTTDQDVQVANAGARAIGGYVSDM